MGRGRTCNSRDHIYGVNQFIEGLLCADAWKIPRVSPQMDECVSVQRRTNPLNELIDAINVVPTVIAHSSS